MKEVIFYDALTNQSIYIFLIILTLLIIRIVREVLMYNNSNYFIFKFIESLCASPVNINFYWCISIVCTGFMTLVYIKYKFEDYAHN